MQTARARGVTRADFRTLALSALGAALEFYDFIIFIFFTSAIAALFFPPDLPEWVRQLQTFGIFAAGYLVRPLGGIVMAHFGDRVGRKKMFLLSVLLMTVPTLLIGLLPTYAAIGIAAPLLLLLLRMLQGAAVGGEVPGAWVFVAEHIPQRIGLACGVLTSGLTVGIVLGSSLATAMQTWLGQDAILAGWWRLPFVLGGVLGLIAVWLRRFLHETPVFEEMRERKALARGLPVTQVLREHRRATVEAMLLTWLLTAGIVVVILMLPTLVSTAFGLELGTVQRANTLATVMLAVGAFVYGTAADRYGAVRVIALGTVLLAAAVVGLFALLRSAPGWFFWAYAGVGFLVGVTGAIPVLLIKAFPAPVRYSGVSFSYNIAYAISGGLTPILVAWWARHSPMAPAAYVVLVALVVLCATVSMRRLDARTHGRQRETLAGESDGPEPGTTARR